MRSFWPLTVLFWLVICLGLGVVRALSGSYVIRFSDAPAVQQAASDGHGTLTLPTSSEPESPAAPADDWIEQHDWKQAWPLLSSASHELSFAGPPTQRYLRITTDNSYYIWSHRLEIDPQQRPFLDITWGVERFPRQAALDLYGRNDRPLVIMVAFGPKVHSPGLLPDVPRALAFFWGETETVGASYTCVTPRNGHEDARLQCNYPHVKYIALRRGNVGTVHTDRINLPDMFRQHFPEYWQEHQRVPPVVGVSFEAGSGKTDSTSSARLYTLVFTAEAPAAGVPQQGVVPIRKEQ